MKPLGEIFGVVVAIAFVASFVYVTLLPPKASDPPPSYHVERLESSDKRVACYALFLGENAHPQNGTFACVPITQMEGR